MNVQISRDLIAQVVIMLAVCVGGWLMLVEPSTKELADLETKIEASGSESVTISQASVESAARRIGAARGRIGEIRRRNLLTKDSTQLYGNIMELAVNHGVTVRQLQPSNDRRQEKDSPFELSQIDMTIEGTFEQMAAFLDEIDTTGGYLRPSSLQLTPLDRGGEHLVNARFSCDAMQFALPETLAKLEGVAHAEP